MRALLVLLALATTAVAAPPGGVVRVEHRDPATPPTRGPGVAPVTIELFFQPTPRLALALPILRALERLQANHPTRVRLVYRVIQRDSNRILAIAALEAQAQGRFEDLIDELHLQRTATSLTRDQVLALADHVGMDSARLDAAISNGRYADAFEDNDRRLQRLLHGSLPGVLFNSAPTTTGSFTGDRDLEAAYRDAYSQAQSLVADGVALAELPAAFDARARHAEQPYVPPPPDLDEDPASGDLPDDVDLDADATQPPLASPALDLAGLPSYGPLAETGDGTLPVVLLCRVGDPSCADQMRQLRALQLNYATEVRIVWAPWFDVTGDDVAKQVLLADAALCAERVGSSPKELEASAGWIWVQRMYDLQRRGPQKDATEDTMIDAVDKDLGIDGGEMSACRASHASTALDWITAARRAGIKHAPTLVIGGRIYEGLQNGATIVELVEAELAPGILGEAAPDYRPTVPRSR